MSITCKIQYHCQASIPLAMPLDKRKGYIHQIFKHFPGCSSYYLQVNKEKKKCAFRLSPEDENFQIRGTPIVKEIFLEDGRGTPIFD